MKTSKSKNSLRKTITGVTIATATLFVFSSQLAFASEINQENLIRLINQERNSRGIPSLKINSDLDAAASLKSKDMINRDYFEHYAFGLSPWDFISNSGYNYLYAVSYTHLTLPTILRV